MRVSPVFGDHMVLQREIPLTVWGLAEPGAPVSVSFRGTSTSATADTDGRWKVEAWTPLETLESKPAYRELVANFYKISKELAVNPDLKAEMRKELDSFKETAGALADAPPSPSPCGSTRPDPLPEPQSSSRM